jgi:hypothetical protein
LWVLLKQKVVLKSSRCLAKNASLFGCIHS